MENPTVYCHHILKFYFRKGRNAGKAGENDVKFVFDNVPKEVNAKIGLKNSTLGYWTIKITLWPRRLTEINHDKTVAVIKPTQVTQCTLLQKN